MAMADSHRLPTPTQNPNPLEAEPGRQNFERFRERVLADGDLQEALASVTDPSAFVDLTVRLGRELGYPFSNRDVENAIQAGRRKWLERWT